MPFTPHIKIVVNGVFGTQAVPNEIWSTSFALATSDGHDADAGMLPTVAEMETYAGVIGNIWGANTSKMPVATLLKSIKASLIGVDGHVVLNGAGAFVQVEHQYSPYVTGHVQQPQYPYQVAWCATLLTAAAGRHGKGRMFLPAPTILAALGSDGLMNVDDRAYMLALAATFVTEAEVAFSRADLVPHVASSDGTNRRVTAIRGGRVYDTIRRRRNGLAEAYVAQTFD